MIKIMLGCGGAFSLLALAACGGSIQSVGDGASGAGGSSAQAHAGGSAAQQHGGSTNAAGGASGHAGSSATAVGGSGTTAGGGGSGRGGEAWGPGTCDPPCSQGYGCYEVANDPAGFCAPLCDTREQGQTADADPSCSNSVRGGAGTCVFSLGFGWPLPDGIDLPILSGGRFVTGLCSDACDPVLQDCPSGYTCDFTDTFSAVAQQGIYACLPNKTPHALGETCMSTGDGECGPGLTCTLGSQGIFNGFCTTFCDRRDTDACPGEQVCTETEVTKQDNDPNIGVCL